MANYLVVAGILNKKIIGLKKAEIDKIFTGNGRAANPYILANTELNKKISDLLGVKFGPALMKFVKPFRDNAKKIIGGDGKDYRSINKEILELIKADIDKRGKKKVKDYIYSL